MLEIDGKKGEGGGQVLRSSLAFSALTGKPFTLTDIRGNRSRPGLRPQHLAAVRLAADLCQAEVAGDRIDSNRLVFHPGKITPGFHRVDVGTAGSVTLLAQAILIPALLAPGPVEFELVGGTDVAMAPPIDYLLEVVLPYYRALGKIEARLERRGFHPKGQGVVHLSLEGKPAPKPLEIDGTITWKKQQARIAVSADLRQAKVVERIAAALAPEIEVEREYVDSASSGAVLTLWATSPEGYKLGSTCLGRPRLPSEELARTAMELLQARLDHPHPVEEHLADQLVPLLTVVGGRMRCQEISLHCSTNMEICSRFTGARFELRGTEVRTTTSLTTVHAPADVEALEDRPT